MNGLFVPSKRQITPPQTQHNVKYETFFCLGIETWNPAFDVTPADLITGGIVTDFGVVIPPINTKQNLLILKMN